jgi:hypothetical protein
MAAPCACKIGVAHACLRARVKRNPDQEVRETWPGLEFEDPVSTLYLETPITGVCSVRMAVPIALTAAKRPSGLSRRL